MMQQYPSRALIKFKIFVFQNGSKKLRSKKYFEKYRQFWDEDQNFDFPRIIGEREEKNKNDIIQRVADGKLDFENSVYSTASSKLPVTT